MEQSFIDEMKEALKTQRSEILKSLATQNDDMKNLIKTITSEEDEEIENRIKEANERFYENAMKKYE